MRVWTDGARVRVWHRRGRFCVTSRGEVTWETRSAAVGPEPLVALTDAGKDLLAHATSPEGAVRVAAVAVDADRIAEIRVPAPGTRAAHGPLLRVGPPDGAPDLELSLVGAPTPLDWPRRLLWEALEPEAWSREEVFEGGAGQGREEPAPGAGLRLTRSPFGLGIAAAGSGHLAMLRVADVSFTHLGRVPTLAGDEAPTVELLPLSAGALVCVTAGARGHQRAALLLLDDEGQVCAHWPAEGGLVCGAMTPRLAPTTNGVLVSHGAALSLLQLPSLQPIATLDGEEPIVALACADDGFAALTPSTLRLGHVGGASIALEQTLSLDALEQEPRTAGWQPEKETGPTNVEAAVQKAPPWRAEAGEAFRLELRLRSVGRAGRALRVRASGPALEDGYLELTRASTSDDEAPFDAGAREARLERALIPQGYKRPVVPKPKNPDQKLTAQALLEGSRLDLVVEGRALKRGRALLRLEIGGLEGPPFRWTRPFVVH